MFQEASNNNNNVQFWLPEQEETEDDLLNTLSPGLSPTMLLSCDILPLVMNDGEVSLDPHPTDSSLPISPIFLNEVQVIKNHNASSKNIIAGEDLPLDLVSVEATVDTSTVQDIDAFLGVYDTNCINPKYILTHFSIERFFKIFTNLFLAEVNDKHHQNMDVVATFALPDEITCASEELKVGISI